MIEPLSDFPAVIVKVQTMQDKTPRVTLDLPETAIGEAGKLMQIQSGERYLHVVIYDADEFQKACLDIQKT